MSSGHLVGRRIQPRFNLVVVLKRHGDGELGALVDVSVDRTRSDRNPTVGANDDAHVAVVQRGPDGSRRSAHRTCSRTRSTA
jgi:hypothetical protein